MEVQRTPEQQVKWRRVEAIRQDIEEGNITDPSALDPRETSIEFVQEAKQKIRLRRALGQRAL